MTKITLYDGTVVENAYCVLLTENQLGVYMPGLNLVEGYGTLCDPQAVSVISAEQYGQTTVYTGFTHLFSLREEPGGLLSAGLRKA